MLKSNCIGPLRWMVLSLVVVFSLGTAKAAEQVTLEHDGLQLFAFMHSVADPADGVVLLLHGTLAHGRMETMAGIQDVLADQGLNSLSVNLSYGIDAREGMFECDQPVTHGLQQHYAELEAWLAWLAEAGYGPVTLLGHSRGANQIARFYHEQAPEGIAGLVLIAPGTHDYALSATQYEAQSGFPLIARLDQAQELLRMDQPSTLMDGVRFLYCESLSVTPEAFLGYYADDPGHDTPTVIAETTTPTLVVIGSEDTVVADLPERMAALAPNPGLTVVTIDGADHFFRDFFADDIVEAMLEFMQQ